MGELAAELVYLLCALTSALCAALLLRSYFRSRTRLLVWSSLAFVGLALNNALLFVDLVLLPTTVDLSLWRNGVALAALSVLVFGLIWDAE
jgi:hypothetical protein